MPDNQLFQPLMIQQPDPRQPSPADAWTANTKLLTGYLDQPQAARPPLWPMSNPVGTETTQGMQSATPIDQIVAMRPDGTPVLASDMARAHADVQQALQVAPTMVLGMMGTTAPGIRGYHGSGADFNAFSDKFIGTGEGHQAYGYGHYVGGAEATGKTYRDANSPIGQARLTGGLSAPEEFAHDLISQGRSEMDTLGALASKGYSFDEANAALEKVKGGMGKMYEVNIAANPEHFLDWDKKLSQQPAVVKKLQTAGIRTGDLSQTGSDLHDALLAYDTGVDKAGRPDQAELAARLKDAGIPGIRYLDQGSRNIPQLDILPPNQSVSGRWMVRDPVFQADSKHFDSQADAQAYVDRVTPKATSNHVVFDPTTIEILRKYGIAGLIAGGGAAAATQQGQPPT